MRSLCSVAFVLFGTLAIPAFSLSGRVVDANGAGVLGISVALPALSITTTTDSDGAWTLAVPSTGISERIQRTRQTADGHLALGGGHLQISLSGFDPMGRPLFCAVPKPIQRLSSGGVPRAAEAVPDTFLYSLNGKIFLRDTASDLSRTGIVAVFDTISNPAIIYGWIHDSRDGHVYRTVRIGNQNWMAQNLNYKIKNSWCYNGADSNCLEYGRLYQWNAILDLAAIGGDNAIGLVDSLIWQGICPDGWRIPTDAEWGTLIAQVGYDSSRIKLSAVQGWYHVKNGTDQYGFSVLPAGLYFNDGTFFDLNKEAEYWSLSEISSESAQIRFFSYADNYAVRIGDYKVHGLSLRCIESEPISR